MNGSSFPLHIHYIYQYNVIQNICTQLKFQQQERLLKKPIKYRGRRSSSTVDRNNKK